MLLAAVVLVGLVLCTLPLEAQNLTAVMRARRDAARARVAAMRRQDSLATLRGRELPVDSLRGGGLTLLAPRSHSALAARGLAVMDSTLRRWTLGADAGSPTVYRVHRDWNAPPAADSEQTTWYLEAVHARGREERVVWWTGPPSAAELGAWLARARRALAWSELPELFRQWLGGEPVDTTGRDIWSESYLRLATAPTLGAQRCMLGDPAGCKRALGLEVSADPLREDLAPATRRAMVLTIQSTVAEWRHRGEHDSLVAFSEKCVEAQDDASCLSLLRAVAPLAASDRGQNTIGRQSLVVAAVTRPGAPGFVAARRRAALTADEAFEAIGGAEVDLIVQEWRSRVIAAEPQRVAPAPGRALAATAWIVLLSGLALRSSRWR